ncbi:MAG: hypothetical protein ILP22_10660 [Oscillospiraceae bacterium]|nr:hypothetical protein [Oscillospiraceae bacterium]
MLVTALQTGEHMNEYIRDLINEKDEIIRESEIKIRNAAMFRMVELALMAFLLALSYNSQTLNCDRIFTGLGTGIYLLVLSVLFGIDMFLTILWILWRKIFLTHFLMFIFLGLFFYWGWGIALLAGGGAWGIVIALFLAANIWLMNFVPFKIFRVEKKAIKKAEKEKQCVLDELQNEDAGL